MSIQPACPRCHGKGYIEYQPADGFQSYQWARWKRRPCNCQDTKTRKPLPLGER